MIFWPDAASNAAVVSRNCDAICASVSFVSDGWFQLWFPMRCPSATIRCSVAAYLFAFSPIAKNVALARCVARASSMLGVRSLGPSS